MVKIPVYDATGKEVRKVDFDESVFGEKVLAKTLKTVVVAYGRNKRQGNANTKARGKVSGSNRKLWRQKGTGRARVGDRRPPHWRGGGIAHGPRTRDFYRRIPARLRHVALASALLSKFQDGGVRVVEGLSFEEGPKTKTVASFLKGSETSGSALFTVAGYNENFVKSVRNIQKVRVRELRDLNAYDVMRHVNLVVSAEALEDLKKGVTTERRAGGDE